MPRRIIGCAFVSLDGVMQAPGAPQEDPSGGFPFGGWLAPLGDEALNNQIGTIFAQPYDLLLGRRTFEIFAAYWPYMPEDDWIAGMFNRVRKYVLSGSDLPLEWAGSERLDGIDALARLKAQDGPDLVIQGSSTLYPQLIADGLLDRLTLITAPVVLGGGKRLFGEGTAPGSWTLIEHRLGSKGIAAATFAPAGPVATGRFGDAAPSPAELARRERWKAEG
jgi:dihydrofolate reductase